jgi:hypothetical protein
MSGPTSRKRKSTNKQPTFPEPVPTVSELPVTVELANLLRSLDHYLFREFGAGATFSYVIGGNGKVLAQSSVHGIVVPSVKAEPEGRVYYESELWQMPDGTKIEHKVYGKGEIKRAYGVDNTDLDDRVAVFKNVSFVLHAPKMNPDPPWDRAVKLTFPADAEINIAFSTRA